MERREAQAGAGWLEARHWLVSGVSRDRGRFVSEMGPAHIVITFFTIFTITTDDIGLEMISMGRPIIQTALEHMTRSGKT